MPLTLRLAGGVLGFPASVIGTVLAADEPMPAAKAEAVSFQNEIRPLLARRCYACHGPDEAAGGLDLTSFESATGDQTDSGDPAIRSGDDASELLVRVRAHEEGYRMPEEGEPLSAEEIDLLARWVKQGGQYDRHWGFEPVQAVQPPSVRAESWVRQPIDRFVLARLEAAGLSPAQEASRRVLIRRLSQDLIGLPPTPEEVEAFVADERPDAYEQLVERLLASPHYGERWARHWLDVARFAETNSFERDGEKANAYTYRDYVIDAFNSDKPYPQFLREQLAGDELVGDGGVDREKIAATGFLRLGLWDDEPADPELHQFEQYDDIVRTVSEGMLGLTVGCARCHDHKIDPIPQQDYYGLVAFFRGVPEFGLRHDPGRFNQVEVTDKDSRKQHAQLDRDLEAVREKMKTIEQRGIVKMPAPDQRASETRKRPRVLKQLNKYLTPEDWTAYKGLKQDRAELEAKRKMLPPREFVLGVTGVDPTPPETHLLERGSPQAPADVVAPRYPEVLGGEEAELPAAAEASSNRRLTLANWIASNPGGATARVMVNRIWQHHFGRGLVRSPNNFGQLGTPPTHPELLDWLATEFAGRGWSVKEMHRLIVTSATYRMSGSFNEEAAAIDPQNDLLWRFDIRRMDAEEVRDAVLAISGTLNLDRVGGPSIFPKLEEEVMAGQSRPGEGWRTSPDGERTRRSLYVFTKRSLPLPLFSAFDFPETDATCEGRFQTVQPAQALLLLNSEFLAEQATELAERLRQEAGDEVDEQISRVLELAYCRPADAESVERFATLHGDLIAAHGVTTTEAMELVCLAVLNTSEFVFVE